MSNPILWSKWLIICSWGFLGTATGGKPASGKWGLLCWSRFLMPPGIGQWEGGKEGAPGENPYLEVVWVLGTGPTEVKLLSPVGSSDTEWLIVFLLPVIPSPLPRDLSGVMPPCWLFAFCSFLSTVSQLTCVRRSLTSWSGSGMTQCWFSCKKPTSGSWRQACILCPTNCRRRSCTQLSHLFLTSLKPLASHCHPILYRFFQAGVCLVHWTVTLRGTLRPFSLSLQVRGRWHPLLSLGRPKTHQRLSSKKSPPKILFFSCNPILSNPQCEWGSLRQLQAFFSPPPL